MFRDIQCSIVCLFYLLILYKDVINAQVLILQVNESHWFELKKDKYLVDSLNLEHGSHIYVYEVRKVNY